MLRTVLGPPCEARDQSLYRKLGTLLATLTLKASYSSFIFLSFCGPHKKHKVPTNEPSNWSPGLICGATRTIFRAGAVPGAPGAPRGPQGAENRPKTRGQIYHFILPKVCPIVGWVWAAPEPHPEHDPCRCSTPITGPPKRAPATSMLSSNQTKKQTS